LNPEVLATALNIYATTQSLVWARITSNVGSDGAAFGTASNATRNVYELLRAGDQQTAFGLLYNGDITLQEEANDLFEALNKALGRYKW
jgi:hypothetical protein